MVATTAHSSTVQPPRVRLGSAPFAVRVAGVIAASLLAAATLVALDSATPAHAAVTEQCNGELNVGGEGLNCEISIENVLDLATGVESSTVTTLACRGAANVDPLTDCVGPTTTNYEELTTEASQCNGSANGGGSSMICSVTVVNTITGDATTSAAPVNQCNGSLTTGDVRACDPDPATTDASVDGITQCNGSVNGGGGSMTCVAATTSTSNSAFDFLVNQCNDSANGAGARIECTVDISTVVLPAAEVPVTPVVPEVPITPVVPEAPAGPDSPQAAAPTLPATGMVAMPGVTLAAVLALLVGTGLFAIAGVRQMARRRIASPSQ